MKIKHILLATSIIAMSSSLTSCFSNKEDKEIEYSTDARIKGVEIGSIDNKDIKLFIDHLNHRIVTSDSLPYLSDSLLREGSKQRLLVKKVSPAGMEVLVGTKEYLKQLKEGVPFSRFMPNDTIKAEKVNEGHYSLKVTSIIPGLGLGETYTIDLLFHTKDPKEFTWQESENIDAINEHISRVINFNNKVITLTEGGHLYIDSSKQELDFTPKNLFTLGDKLWASDENGDTFFTTDLNEWSESKLFTEDNDLFPTHNIISTRIKGDIILIGTDKNNRLTPMWQYIKGDFYKVERSKETFEEYFFPEGKEIEGRISLFTYNNITTLSYKEKGKEKYVFLDTTTGLDWKTNTYIQLPKNLIGQNMLVYSNSKNIFIIESRNNKDIFYKGLLNKIGFKR